MLVGRGCVLAFGPAAIAGHAPLRFVLHAPRRGDQQAQFLFRLVRAGGVDDGGTRIEMVHRLEQAARLPGAPVLAAGAIVRPGNRANRLEEAQVFEAVIGREQAVEARRARSHRTDDDHWRDQRFSEDFAFPLEPLLRPQALAHDLEELPRRRDMADRVERGFRLQRFDEDFQRLKEPGIAEIVEPGLLAGDRTEFLYVELHLRHDGAGIEAGQYAVGYAHKR